MKFTLSSSYLLKNIQVLSGVIPPSTTLPILHNFLFEIEHNKLRITASDLETTMTTTLDVESETIGTIAIPGKLLLDTLKTFPEQPLTFTVRDNNTIEINSNSGEYILSYITGDRFPKAISLSNLSTTALPSKTLSTAISKTVFATSTDDLQPNLCGVLFKLSTQGVLFVATDAHRLVEYARTDVKASQVADFIMPKKPLHVLKSILGTSDDEVKIEYNDSNATFSFDNYVLNCRLVDGKYPNYKAIIPKDSPNHLLINRTQLLKSVNCVGIFSSKSLQQVRLKIAGKELNISAEDKDYSNKADERLSCDYQGDDMQIGFNAKYLAEMLKNLDSEDVRIELSLPNKAGLILPADGLDEGEKITMLVMPSLIN
ncbi:MAG: DNA polymerase III subunit beta [Flavobacterium sp. MedPE-SWcel]|uniref:DNA polymerase III subunit beta n=1 Tax=uncultured Flavobacterium sp. TaxID=165435 RepID=UPI000915F88D|nr:DNA polymerase III subunit beta [uncultured Flavobacterium sp.]OIQ22177.1 MAG: DNA polymerase III subunit beta [Flavobacterium sp. MedPE-SWcel]